MPQVKELIADEAQIRCYCGCGVDRQLQLRFQPLAWKPPYALGAGIKKKIERWTSSASPELNGVVGGGGGPVTQVYLLRS